MEGFEVFEGSMDVFDLRRLLGLEDVDWVGSDVAALSADGGDIALRLPNALAEGSDCGAVAAAGRLYITFELSKTVKET